MCIAIGKRDYLPHIMNFGTTTTSHSIMSMATDPDQGETVIIRHGLRQGSLPDEVKQSLVAKAVSLVSEETNCDTIVGQSPD